MPTKRDPKQTPPDLGESKRRRFTNRVKELERFRALLNGPAGGPLPLLMFYGVGGAGKTSLLDRLKEAAGGEHVPWAAVDLKVAAEADDALPRLAKQLIDEHHFRFDTFARVLTVLTAKQTGGSVPSGQLARLETAGQASDLGLDLLGLIPGVGQIAAAIKLTKGASLAAFRESMKRSKSFRQAVAKLGGESEVLRLIEQDEDVLTAELIRAFADDLCRSLPTRPNHAGRTALFLDTHETLWRDTSGGAASQAGDVD